MAEHSRAEVPLAKGDRGAKGGICSPPVGGQSWCLVESLQDQLACQCYCDLGLVQNYFKEHLYSPRLNDYQAHGVHEPQGTKSLTEYLHAFNNLSRYAPEMVDTEANKLASFKRGLGPKLSKNMAGNKSTTFNKFVSDALTQENSNAVYAMSKNRKRAYEAGASQSKAPVTNKLAYRSPNTVPRYRPPQKKSNVKTGVRKSFIVALPRGAMGQGGPKTPPDNRPCFNCKQVGHWALIPRGIL